MTLLFFTKERGACLSLIHIKITEALVAALMSQLLLNSISMTIFECMQIRRWSCSRIFLWPRLNIWYGALYELLLSRGVYHQDACLIFFRSRMLLLKCRVFVTRAVKWDLSTGLSHTSFFLRYEE